MYTDPFLVPEESRSYTLGVAFTPRFARGLSFFHFWLPFFLVYLVWRIGYDRRAFAAWTTLACVLLAARLHQTAAKCRVPAAAARS